MTQKSILITGCSSGIGEAAAHTMKARGWRVFATARKKEDIKRLKDAGLESLYLDYAEPESIAACAGEVLDAAKGGLFALFNNGTYGQGGAVEDIRTDVMREQFESGFFGWHDLTLRVLPTMRAQRAGRIVNCSSVLGIAPMAYRGPYNAMKFALEGLTLTMAFELKGTGIAVSLIEPGPIRTRFADNALTVFKKNVDVENSPHRELYERRLKFLEKGGSQSRFKLEPSAVVDKLIHAVESPNPKPHYFVTTPTYLIDAARRFLPVGLYHRLLQKAGDNA